MKNAVTSVLLLAVILALPAHAQEEFGEDAAIETTPVDEADGETVDTVPVEEEDAAEAEPAEPRWLYVGADVVGTTLSDQADIDAGMYRLRGGMRLFEGVNAEAHYGFDWNGKSDVKTKGYYGLFAVPTASLFDTFELAFPLGYASTRIAGENLDSIAYGVNAELPFKNLRFGAGWMVYYQKSDARLYGWNLGVRFDFDFNDYEFFWQ